jgi:hypothetical protein
MLEEVHEIGARFFKLCPALFLAPSVGVTLILAEALGVRTKRGLSVGSLNHLKSVATDGLTVDCLEMTSKVMAAFINFTVWWFGSAVSSFLGFAYGAAPRLGS